MSRTAESPFSEALEALRAPLRFTARDDFARSDRVRNLEQSVREAAARCRVLAIPRDLRRALESIEKAFAAPLEGPARVRAVRSTLERSAPWADPDFGERALGRPVTALPGLGPRRAAVLDRRGIRSVADLLFHLPVRYDDRRHLVRVADLEVGRRSTFLAHVLVADLVPSRRLGARFRRVLQAVVGDDTGTVELKWFHGGEALRELVHKGATLLVTGEVRRYRFAKELRHPEVEPVEVDGEGGSVDLEGLREVVPEYATPEGIPPRALRRYVQAAVAEYADLVASHLPESLAHERRLPSAANALRVLHRPRPDADLDALLNRRSPAHQRLVLEELYLLELGLALRREKRQREAGVAIALPDEGWLGAVEALPFRPTGAQERVVAEIRRDLERAHPMNRLLQGDVGSGKTAVAFLAAAGVARAGHQAALMAPTELLAEQHARTLRRLAEHGAHGPSLRIGLLTASLPRAQAQATRRSLEKGELDLVLGTHSLLQEGTRFASLALAVIDEQHRFGVLQRAALAGKGAGGRSPHVLVMTATPIPRTLALTLYGELDVSVLDELPPGRTPVTTDVLREGEGARIADLVRDALARGEQVYVVYPLVEESEKSDLRAVTESAERIARAFPEVRVDLVHGRLEAAARAEAMARFEAGETQILVSTTVIEVGIDVANATLMIVEHAERFGLAQLHQLRGRVGRGRRAGTCLLVARGSTEESEARLRAMLESSDGFEIAEADLRIRGPGEFLGTRQSGRLPDLRLADLARDARLISVAREAALDAVRRDPGLRSQDALRRAVAARWGARLALVDVG